MEKNNNFKATPYASVDTYGDASKSNLTPPMNNTANEPSSIQETRTEVE